MWIIPNNLTVSPSVRATLESSWDLKELSRILEPSVMWRSKPSLARTWLQRLNRVSWLKHLSGRILKPSMENRFATEYTSSLAVIPASPSQSPASEKENQTPDTFGRILKESSRQLDLFGASSRTSQDILQSDSPQFAEAYEIYTTMLRQDYLGRWKSECYTTENGYLSLPTPTSTMTNLSRYCQMVNYRFVTIRKGTGLQYGSSLTGALEMNQPRDLVSNPCWIEEMMGLKVGWTDLGSWETE